MNTRNTDLAALETQRDIAVDREHYQALLESVYEQSKDAFLERKRLELIEWLKKGFAAVPEEGTPTTAQRQIMAEAEMNTERIEKEIKAYTATPEYQARLAAKIAKISSKEADLVMVKQKKGFL